jgi:hypothetical protein
VGYAGVIFQRITRSLVRGFSQHKMVELQVCNRFESVLRVQ